MRRICCGVFGRVGIVLCLIMLPVWVMQHAVGNAAEFLKVNREKDLDGCSNSPNQAVRQDHWSLPSPGLVKVNFDGAFVQNLNVGGVAVGARADDGSFLFARACGGLKARSAIVMEGLALRTGVLLAKERGIQRVIFEGDAKGLIEVLNGKSAGCEDIQLLVLDILQLCRSFFDVFSFVLMFSPLFLLVDLVMLWPMSWPRKVVVWAIAQLGWLSLHCGCGILSVMRNSLVSEFFVE
ncbi:hypothetical protein Vadar_013355 [Vaccinium darrowii]|uniref:Uncharacterized protein n=1 Tax=Vaccinium darrowii TaxID=229202 RepID=A0ACB7XZD1_9ERIC|nr:hypothetical protein Vadar_013355 [Vaccinium darrowii]